MLGIAAAEAMKYFNVFETENDKLADATKEVDRYNKSVKEQAEILGGGAFTLDEAIDKYYQYETAVNEVDAQINMLNDYMLTHHAVSSRRFALLHLLQALRKL